MSVAEAKASLSSLLSTVSRRRRPITILRRGVPIATIIPVETQTQPLLAGSMAGTARELGDIISPAAEEWFVNDDWTHQA